MRSGDEVLNEVVMSGDKKVVMKWRGSGVKSGGEKVFMSKRSEAVDYNNNIPLCFYFPTNY